MLKYKVDGSNANNIYMTTQFASKDRLCVCMCVYTCVCVCACTYMEGCVPACVQSSAGCLPQLLFNLFFGTELGAH